MSNVHLSEKALGSSSPNPSLDAAPPKRYKTKEKRRADGIGRYVLWGATLLALVACILYPTIRIFHLAISDAATGNFDLGVMIETLADPATWQSTVNTLGLGFVATFIGVLLAIPMAWTCSRTNVPLGALTKGLIFLTFMNPPILIGLAYITIFGPGNGILAWIPESLGLGSIYSWWGLVLVTVCSSFPIIFMLLLTALETLDADLENAAAAHGASRIATAARITLPLVRPALASGCLLSFVLALNSFGVQALIAIPAGIPLLTTDIYSLFSYPVQFTSAANLALILIVASVLVSVAVNAYIFKTTFPTIAGKGFRPDRMRVSRPIKIVGSAYNFAVLAVTLVVPMAVMVATSFLPTSREFNFSALSLDAYATLGELGSTKRALLNSAGLGVAASVLMVLLATSITYFQRQKTRLSSIARVLAEIPFVIPGIVLAVGMIAAYSRQPLMFYGTYFILLLAYVGKFLPIALRFTQNAFGQVGHELEESAYAHGGNRWQTLRIILFPLVRKGVLSATIISFVFAFNELSASILLISSGKEVTSTVLLTYAEEGLVREMSAFATILFIITALSYVLVTRLAGKDVFAVSGQEK